MRIRSIIYFLLVFVNIDGLVFADTARVETSISEPNPYMKQAVIYTMKIVYDPKSVEITNVPMPVVENAVVDNVNEGGEPKTYFEQQYAVAEYQYSLIPLAAGDLTIPEIEITLKSSSQYNRSSYPSYNRQSPYPYQNYNRQLPYPYRNYTQPPQYSYPNSYPNYNQYPQYSQAQNPQAQSFTPIPTSIKTKATHLRVRPRANFNYFWLPLYDLKISGYMDSANRRREGEPINYTITLEARGSRGEDLPSIASLVQNKDFKWYLESSSTENNLSTDGKTIVGKRIETYTVVPQSTGILELPSIQVMWWDVQYHKETWSELPAKKIGIGSSEAKLDRLEEQQYTVPFYQSVGYLGFAIIGFAIFFFGAWMGAGRPGVSIITKYMDKMLLFCYRHLEVLFQMISRSTGKLSVFFQSLQRSQRSLVETKRRYGLLFWLLQRLDKYLPTSLRIYRFMRRLEFEATAEDVASLMTKFAGSCLNMPDNSPLENIARVLCNIYPQVNPIEVNELFQELQSAVYNQQAIDIKPWKTRFQQQFQHLAVHQLCVTQPKARTGLPALNP